MIELKEIHKVLLDNERFLELFEIFPDIAAMVGFDQKSSYHYDTLAAHTFKVYCASPPEVISRYAALFHDIGKLHTQEIDENGEAHYNGHAEKSAEIAQKILVEIRESPKIINDVVILVKEHMNKLPFNSKNKTLLRQKKRVGEHLVAPLYDLMIADMKARLYNPDELIELYSTKEKILNLKLKPMVKKSTLNIGGKDLIELGYKEGPKIGKILNFLEEKIKENPKLNTKEQLIKLI